LHNFYEGVVDRKRGGFEAKRASKQRGEIGPSLRKMLAAKPSIVVGVHFTAGKILYEIKLFMGRRIGEKKSRLFFGDGKDGHFGGN